MQVLDASWISNISKHITTIYTTITMILLMMIAAIMHHCLWVQHILWLLLIHVWLLWELPSSKTHVKLIHHMMLLMMLLLINVHVVPIHVHLIIHWVFLRCNDSWGLATLEVMFLFVIRFMLRLFLLFLLRLLLLLLLLLLHKTTLIHSEWYIYIAVLLHLLL